MGMLNTLVDKVLSGEINDAYLCPTCIQYEKVFEGETFSNELLGMAKQPESLTGLLSSARKIFKLQLGSIHIR